MQFLKKSSCNESSDRSDLNSIKRKGQNNLGP